MPGSGSPSACWPPRAAWSWPGWLPLPIRFTRPGLAGRAAMIAAWVASIAALLVCSAIYLRQEIHDVQAAGLSVTAPRLTILPVTLTTSVTESGGT